MQGPCWSLGTEILLWGNIYDKKHNDEFAWFVGETSRQRGTRFSQMNLKIRNCRGSVLYVNIESPTPTQSSLISITI